nr:Uncharacterised protein [Klebsiella pneumoniae]
MIRFLWHGAHQLRRDTVRCEYVVTCGVLNVDKLIFRRDLLEGEDLYAVFAAARRMQQQILNAPFPRAPVNVSLTAFMLLSSTCPAPI